MDGIYEAGMRHFEAVRPLLPMYIHLILSALFPIFTGAHASLSRPSSAAQPDKDKKPEEEREEQDDDDDSDDDDEEEVVQQMEGLSPQDAIVFPVTASIVLAGLYFLIKRYGAEIVNFILGKYFAAVGVYSVSRLTNDAASVALSFLFPAYFVRQRALYKIDQHNRKAVVVHGTGSSLSRAAPWAVFPDFVSRRIWSVRSAVSQKYRTKAYLRPVGAFKANLTIVNILAAGLGLASIIYANVVETPWWLTNLQGFAVCYSAMQLMSPTTFATGSLILSGLFFYDIWAVFFTPLMVTVAKNIDQPIKLVFPRPDEPSLDPNEPPIRSYSMLGLGDIVLPGIMIGLALRFDLYMFYLRKQKPADGADNAQVAKAKYTRVTGAWGEWFWTMGLPASSRPSKLAATFPKPYFTASMLGYVIGMLTTLGVMSVFQHAQPALLYLVPGVLISLWSCGLVRGELKEMWAYTEAITGEQLAQVETPKEDQERGKKPEESWPQYIWRSVFGAADAMESSEAKDQAEKEKTTAEQLDDADLSQKDLIVFFSVAEWKPAGKASKAKRSSVGDKISGGSGDGVVKTTATDHAAVDDNAAVTRSRTGARARKS